MTEKKWTENDVLRVLADPGAVLMGIVTEDVFVATAMHAIKDVGPERYIRALLANVREMAGRAT